jgi:hypothetical protein
VTFAPFAADPYGARLQRRLSAFIAFYRSCGADLVPIHLHGTKEFDEEEIANGLFEYPDELKLIREPKRYLEVGLYSAQSERIAASAAQIYRSAPCALIHVAHHAMWLLVSQLLRNESPPPIVLDDTGYHPDAEPALGAASLVVVDTPEKKSAVASTLKCRCAVLLDGTYPPPRRQSDAEKDVHACFGSRPYVLLESSLTTWDPASFVSALIDDGFFFTPPAKHVAITGAITEPMFYSTSYQRFIEANSDRVQFFAAASKAVRAALRSRAHAALVPASALDSQNYDPLAAIVAHKWLIATPAALSSTLTSRNHRRVIVAENVSAFRAAIARVLRDPAPLLGPTDVKSSVGLFWDSRFAASGLDRILSNLITTRFRQQ